MRTRDGGGRRRRLPAFSLRPCACILLVMAACTAAPAPAATPGLPALTPVPTPVPGALYVDAAQHLGPISPLVYGTNYGPAIAVPVALKAQAVAAHLTYLRFPGGAYGDDNVLQDYQIDQFVALCREWGSVPSISVRLKNGTPAEAARMVQYANVTRQYGVRYWSIGNEPSLYAKAAHMDYDTVRYNREWRAMAEAMRAVDPSILLVGPDVNQFTADPAANPKDAAGRDWTTEFLKANGDLVDVVSIHRYPFPKKVSDGPPAIDDLRANSREWDAILPALRALIRETTGRDLPVAVTEINSSWSSVCCGEATPDSLYNAIWWADTLGRMIRQGTTIVAQFLLQSSPGGYGGAMGLLANYDVRPTYYVYQMYQRFGVTLVYASSDDPDVSVFAARREDGALTLMIVNLGPQAADKPLRVAGFTPAPSGETWRLDADHKAERVDPTPVAEGGPLHLPAQSVTLLILTAK